MGMRVAQRRRRGKAPAIARERRRAQQRRVQAQIENEVRQVLQAVFEAALAAEVTERLGRAKYARRQSGSPRPAGVRCSRCQLDWATRLHRAGSYQRTVLTLSGAVPVRVPRLACCCGGTVPLAFATLERSGRGWSDVAERVRQLAGLCLSLRDIQEVVARTSGQVLACSTLNRWVQQVASLADALREGPLERIPPVVLLDGIWLKLMRPTGERYQDRLGRQRPRQRRVKVPLLIAYGVDPTTGARWMLDWELGTGEDQASWQRLLERLYQRGLRADTGLTLFLHDGSSGLDAAFGEVYFGPDVLHQRCVFHILRTLREAVQGEAGMSREAKRTRQREVLQAAATIWQATDRTELQRRRKAFQAAWEQREPQVVAKVEQTVAVSSRYLDALERGRERGEVWQARYLRTTSLLERANRGFRQKARQVAVFHSEVGLKAALVLVVAHRHLDRDDSLLWTDRLEEALLDAA